MSACGLWSNYKETIAPEEPRTTARCNCVDIKLRRLNRNTCCGGFKYVFVSPRSISTRNISSEIDSAENIASGKKAPNVERKKL